MKTIDLINILKTLPETHEIIGIDSDRDMGATIPVVIKSFKLKELDKNIFTLVPDEYNYGQTINEYIKQNETT